MKKKFLGLAIVLCLVMMNTINSWAFTFYPDTSYMYWPTTSQRVTDTFGTPRSEGRTHTGIDIGGVTAGVAGDPIYSALGGTVKDVANKTYGVVVYVNSRGYNPWLNKYEYVQTRYVHVEEDPIAEPGESVNRGEKIATMGGTGGYPIHLHFETRIGTTLNMGTSDSATIPRDPLVSYTDAQPYKLPVNFTKQSLVDSLDDVGEYGIVSNNMLYSVDFIMSHPISEVYNYGITDSELKELLSTLKANNSNLYEQLNDYLN